MGLFRRHQNEEIDLSDEGLLAASEGSGDDGGDTATAGGENDTLSGAEDRAEREGITPSADSPDPSVFSAGLPDRETVWRQSISGVVRDWPQVSMDMPAVVRKMAQISARYGDATLWQRAPGAVMREAAAELYGSPPRPSKGALAGAIQKAHAQGLRAAQAINSSKAGLAPPQVSRSAAPPLSEDEKIIQEMMAAKKSSIF